MIKEVKNQDLKNIELFIGNEYYKCLYLYLDMKKYGISDENIKIWIQNENNNENNIVSVILKYFSGMHIYSKNIDYNTSEIIKIIKEEKPSMICAERKIINKINIDLEDANYKAEFGFVRKLSKLKIEKSHEVEKANPEDFYEIAKLLYEDEDIGSSYKLNELSEQMLERYKEGYSRNYIIRKDNQIAAHAGTGAEINNVAVMSYVVTNKKFRRKGLATKVCATLCRELLDEGKEIYLINYSNESTNLYDKLGFEVCSDWGKLYRNLKEEEKRKC